MGFEPTTTTLATWYSTTELHPPVAKATGANYASSTTGVKRLVPFRDCAESVLTAASSQLKHSPQAILSESLWSRGLSLVSRFQNRSRRPSVVSSSDITPIPCGDSSTLGTVLRARSEREAATGLDGCRREMPLKA